MPSAPFLLAIALLLLPWALAPRAGQGDELRGALPLLWYLDRLYCFAVHRLDAPRMAPLPATGGAILISNHTCGIDNMLLQATTRRVLGFLIAREFYDAWYCRPFCRLLRCIPVKRDGRDLAATRAALRALEEGRVVPIFPEGRITPTSGRELGDGKPGVAFIALTAGVPVIPAYISGTPETNDVFRALRTPSNARVVFGEPVDLSSFQHDGRPDRETLAAATEHLMAAIRALRDRERAESGPCPT
jgi:1-acyl-sn-glycerol-3-phosphate acyltransferase